MREVNPIVSRLFTRMCLLAWKNYFIKKKEKMKLDNYEYGFTFDTDNE